MVHYRASSALLTEIWDALREPVTPWKSALAQQAIGDRTERAQRRGGDQFHSCCDEILFRAAGDSDLTPKARAELALMLRPHRLAKGRVGSSSEPWLAKIAAFCLKLEMLGFDLDSRPICEAVRGRIAPQAKPTKILTPHHINTMWMEDRFKHRVVVRVHKGGRRWKVRTLRTHRGFILQASLGRDLDPVRLDVFGPKYSNVSDWMALLREDKAWSLELRDVPGYDPGTRKTDRGWNTLSLNAGA